jgi:methylphosphotriester-DNA--protein-cysteine methyltransferase
MKSNQQPTSKELELAEIVKKFLLENIQINYTKEELKKQFQTTDYFFDFTFKNIVGMTPEKWLFEQRMELAAVLLLTENYKLVAPKVGYIDPEAFRKAYTNRFPKKPDKLN